MSLGRQLEGSYCGHGTRLAGSVVLCGVCTAVLWRLQRPSLSLDDVATPQSDSRSTREEMKRLLEITSFRLVASRAAQGGTDLSRKCKSTVLEQPSWSTFG